MGESRAIPPHEIIVVRPGQAGREDLWQHCYNLRIQVFHREQNFPADTERDDLEETGTHFLLRIVPSLMPIGTIRATKSRSEHHKLSRLAVLEDYRQYGFGRALVSALHDWVKQDAAAGKGRDLVRVACHSQIYAKGFYEKCGYKSVGEEFEEDGALHQKMIVTLKISQATTYII